MTKTKYVPVKGAAASNDKAHLQKPVAKWKQKYYDKCAARNNDELFTFVLIDVSLAGSEMSSKREYEEALISEAVLRERLVESGFLKATP